MSHEKNHRYSKASQADIQDATKKKDSKLTAILTSTPEELADIHSSLIGILEAYDTATGELSSTAQRLANITYESKRWFSDYKGVLAKSPALGDKDKAKLIAGIERIETLLGNYERDFIKEAQEIGECASSIPEMLRRLKSGKFSKCKDSGSCKRQGSKTA